MPQPSSAARASWRRLRWQ
ncbi:hypothetical protein LINGRAHAP2_LOCUS22045 [Linum grandiflorum]